MDKIWRLLTAIFLLLTGVALLVLAYVLFQNSVFAIVSVYGALICIAWGIAKGLFTIIDHHRENKSEE